MKWENIFINTRRIYSADCGGSNGYRVRLWKFELQNLLMNLSLLIHVCHFPPGTRKWNKIEHRMFCYISQNWRGKPLSSRQVVVNLISNTKNSKGLTIQARLDENEYNTGIKVTDADFSLITIEKNDFHGEWNYRILGLTHCQIDENMLGLHKPTLMYEK